MLGPLTLRYFTDYWHRSDPRSPKYGKHYTADEVIELFAPASSSIDLVLAWLIEYGIQETRISQSANKAWLQFDASVEEMEQLLQTKYHFYEHINGGRKHIGCEDYKIPASVADHIDFVTPGVKLLATSGIGEIRKRFLSASPNSKPIQKPMPADVLAKIKQNPGMSLKSAVILPNGLMCWKLLPILVELLSRPPVSKRCTTSRLALSKIPKTLWEFSSLAIFTLKEI